MKDKVESEISKLISTIDLSRKPGLLDNYLKPNTQYIQRGKQFSRLAKEAVNVIEKFRDDLNLKHIKSATIRTGSGFLINTQSYNIKDINRDNFIEIIDFDPVRNNMMVIGTEPPADDASIHWFVYRGLPEVNGIIVIDDLDIFNKFEAGSFATVTNDDEILHLDLALEILKCVKDSEISLIDIRGFKGIIIREKTISGAYNLFKKNLKKYSPSSK
jgi:hypothetical protein